MIICFSCLHKDKMDAEDNGKICEYSFYINNLVKDDKLNPD